MAVLHTGKAPAKLKEFMSPYDQDTFYMVWEDKLGNPTLETIVASEWIVPDGFLVGAEQVDIEVTDSKGVVYQNGNSAVISTDSDNTTLGSYVIYNEITTATRIIRRGFEVEVKEI